MPGQAGHGSWVGQCLERHVQPMPGQADACPLNSKTFKPKAGGGNVWTDSADVLYL